MERYQLYTIANLSYLVFFCIFKRHKEHCQCTQIAEPIRMALSDRIKVTILAVGYMICLATVWTAPSIMMGNASMRKVSPPISQYCKAAQMAARQCRPGNGCEALVANEVKCEEIVRKAYRHINLGGCPMEIKAWTLCEDEWCQKATDPLPCLSECAGVRLSLETCQQNVVESYFKSHSLEKDGTTKIQ